MSATDPGYFGQGMYFTFELDYAAQFGDPDAQGDIIILVCNVVVFKMHPVLEVPSDLLRATWPTVNCTSRLI